MKPNYIINSLMDTDWYIFTMAQLFLHNHPTAIGRDAFKCRNPKETLFSLEKPSFVTVPEYIDRLEREIDHYCSLRFQPDELKWLSKHSYYKSDFIDWLEDFRPKRRYINVIRNDDGTFGLNIEGPIVQNIWFEVPILATISEIYGSGAISEEEAFRQGSYNQNSNMMMLNRDGVNMNIADFGTRRRHSHDWQSECISNFYTNDRRCFNFVGTSNAYFAMIYDLTPIGTMAHKSICAYQQLGSCRIIDSQKTMFQEWANEYRGDLGIALSDTLGFDKFLGDFDKYFAKLFDGARHDSGDPIVWGNKLIQHYRNLNINPFYKTAVFSDGLDFKSAVKLFQYFYNKIQTSFGIGTKFTNDVGYTAPQIVIKLVECNGHPVAKVSDDPGKTMCEDKEYINYLNYLLK